MSSYAIEVIAERNGTWTGNDIRVATREEGERYAQDLAYRWLAVREWRVVESSDPVNYRFVDRGLERLGA